MMKPSVCRLLLIVVFVPILAGAVLGSDEGIQSDNLINDCLPPIWTQVPPPVVFQNHCDSFIFVFAATEGGNIPPADPLVFWGENFGPDLRFAVKGNEHCLPTEHSIHVENSCGAEREYSFTIFWTNNEPQFTNCPEEIQQVEEGEDYYYTLIAFDSDTCDELGFSVLSANPTPPPGSYNVSSEGEFSFETSGCQACGLYVFEIEVGDNCDGTDICYLQVLLGPIARGDYTIAISNDYTAGNEAAVGGTNTMEIWIANEQDVTGMTTPVRITFSTDGWQWNMAYGSDPPVNEEGRAIGAFDNLTGLDLIHYFNNVSPETLSIGGAALPGAGIPAGVSDICYTLQFDVTCDGTPGYISVYPQFLPPAGTWTFYDAGGSYPPDFFGAPTCSQTDPQPSIMVFLPIVEINLPPQWNPQPPDEVYADHCVGWEYQFHADEGGNPCPPHEVAYYASGGDIDMETGLFSTGQPFDPTPNTYSITAVNGHGQSINHNVTVHWTNNPPEILDCPPGPSQVNVGSTLEGFLTVTDPDICDEITFSVQVWGNQPAGDYGFDGPMFYFTPDPSDRCGLFYFVLIVDDGFGGSDFCNHTVQVGGSNCAEVCVHVSNPCQGHQDEIAIGYWNTLEVWVANNPDVTAMTLPLQMDFLVNFFWDEDWGTYPPGAVQYVQEEGKAIGAFDLGGLQVIADFPVGPMGTPQKLVLKGSAQNNPLPTGPSEMCYTLRFCVPAPALEIPEALTVKPIFYPPDNPWLFDFGGGDEVYPPFCGQMVPDGYDPVVTPATFPTITCCPAVFWTEVIFSPVDVSLCGSVDFAFLAHHPDYCSRLGSITYSGDNISPTGHFYIPAPQYCDSQEYTVTATSDCGSSVDYTFSVRWGSSKPQFVTCTSDTGKIAPGQSYVFPLTAEDVDACDQLTYNIVGVQPLPVGGFIIDGQGIFTFNTDDTDSGQVFEFDFSVSDDCDSTDYCHLCVAVVAPVPGDADGNQIFNISDVIYVISYIFGGGPPPNPPSVADVNCDGITNVSDVVYMIAFIFAGGPMPCDPDGDGYLDC